MFVVYLAAFAQGVSEEIDRMPTSSPSIEATAPSETEGTDSTEEPMPAFARPLLKWLRDSRRSSLPPEPRDTPSPRSPALADLFVASDLDNATLRTIAESDGALTDTDALYGFAEVLGDTDAVAACFTP